MNATQKRQLRGQLDPQLPSWWTEDRTARAIVIAFAILAFALAAVWLAFVEHHNHETWARMNRAQENQPAERWATQ